MAALERAGLGESRPVQAGRAILRTYAAVLFSRAPLVGLLLLLATMTAPRALAGGLLAVLAALGAARLLVLDHEAVHDGTYGASALLLGLGIGQTLGISAATLVLLFTLAPLCVVVTGALRSFLGGVNLPLLSIPFLIMFYLMLGLLPFAGLTYTPPPSDTLTILPASILAVLRSIGAIFFLPRADAGALLLLALLVHSRIAALLAVLAAATVLGLKLALPVLGDSGQLGVLTLNAVFTAIALGGVWFVPSPASLLWALLGVLLCTLLTLGSAEPMYRLGLPILIVPFNLTVLLMLLCSRQRAWDRSPKSVDFSPGTPEENLAYFRTRLLRFRWLYPTRFRIPVRGTWICTQGVDGALSHQGRWRHAFDFEVKGPDGKLHEGEGNSPKDYYCYRLPVLAAAAGVVAKVENTVPDNDCGRINLQQNWGNYVVLHHSTGLYSLVAHLQRGSVKVVVGQAVRQGELLGLCGNSGRSPRPHVHFQLQSGNRPGDPTLPCRFTDAVSVEKTQRVVADLCPIEDQLVRNLEHDEERNAFFAFPYRSVWRFRINKLIEQIESDIDVNGQPLLRQSDHSARLYYSLADGFFTTYDSAGATTPGLQILRASLSRIPLDASDSLSWTDYLPARPFRSWLGRVLTDIVSPFLHRDGIEMEYQMQRSGTALVVTGESRGRDRQGRPLLRTRAELALGSGPLRAAITLRGQTWTMERESDMSAIQGGSGGPEPAPAATAAAAA